MKIELYKLTKDIPNPSYNKRCKYGFRAKKFFEQGKLVTVRIAKLSAMLSLDIDPAKDREVRHAWIDNNLLNSDLTQDILDNCELLDESSLSVDDLINMYQIPGNTIVRVLVRSGKVSIEDIHKIYKDLQ